MWIWGRLDGCSKSESCLGYFGLAGKGVQGLELVPGMAMAMGIFGY